MTNTDKLKNPKKLKLCLVAGARPNFMKIAPLIRAIRTHNHAGTGIDIDCLLVHTGQHYDYEMSEIFFDELEIPEPDVYLNVGSGRHGEQTGKIMIAFEKVVIKEKPDIVAVVGDVNSTIACALAAAKCHVHIAHVEAGLRSFDRSMPEEINRLLTDQISDYLFTPSPDAEENLKKEGISSEKIFPVGNIMIDNLFYHLEKSRGSDIFEKMGLLTGSDSGVKDYALLTLHRPVNVDDKPTLIRIFDALKRISEKIPVIFPVHPRTQKRIAEFSLNEMYDLHIENIDSSIHVRNTLHAVKSLGYLDFLALMSKAMIVFTDSGGIQEETTVLGIPCLTLRDSTERPVTVTEGTNLIVGSVTDKIVGVAEKVLDSSSVKGRCPELWDGRTSERITKRLSA